MTCNKHQDQLYLRIPNISLAGREVVTVTAKRTQKVLCKYWETSGNLAFLTRETRSLGRLGDPPDRLRPALTSVFEKVTPSGRSSDDLRCELYPLT